MNSARHVPVLRIIVWPALAFIPVEARRPGDAMTVQERPAYLNKLLQTIPDSPPCDRWLETSGELPPDFDALPHQSQLPGPLTTLDGTPVRSLAMWRERTFFAVTAPSW